MVNESNQRELVALLKEIDERLSEKWPGRKTVIYVFGGAAAVIAYAARRGTVDLDIYFEDLDVEAKLLEWAGQGSELDRKFGVYIQSANTTLMLLEDPEWRKRSAEIMQGAFKGLRVKALSKEDLILSKLSRYNERDREDIRHLIKDCDAKARILIKSYKAARSYYVGDTRRLDQTFNIVLKEHFDMEPITF